MDEPRLVTRKALGRTAPERSADQRRRKRYLPSLPASPRVAAPRAERARRLLEELGTVRTGYPETLLLLCSACHTHHHAGRLAITGTADRLEVRRIAESPPPARAEGAGSDACVGEAPGPSAHVGAAGRLDAAITCAQARDALIAMGWKPSLARPAVCAASAALGAAAPLEQVIAEALRRCPRPIVAGG